MPSSIVIVRWQDPVANEFKYLVVEGGEFFRERGREIKITREEYDRDKSTGRFGPRASHGTGRQTEQYIYVPRNPSTWGFVKGEIKEARPATKWATARLVDETPIECAIRELLEETGIRLPDIRFTELAAPAAAAGGAGRRFPEHKVFYVTITDEEKAEIERYINKKLGEAIGELLAYQFVNKATLITGRIGGGRIIEICMDVIRVHNLQFGGRRNKGKITRRIRRKTYRRR